MSPKYLVLILFPIFLSISCIKHFVFCDSIPIKNGTYADIKIALPQGADSIYTVTSFDTIKVDNIIFTDSATGVIYKEYNRTIIRKTIQFLHSNKINHFLSDNSETILLYDEKMEIIDWIDYQIGDKIISRSRKFIEYAL